jgi:tubulin polyglutamylase complex subunit 2
MNKQSSRDIFDIISLNVIGFLENHIGITDVEFIERSGIAEMSLTTWEEENAPYTLPEDYKAFLQIFDGMSLSWRIKRGDQEIPLGNMHLNKLRDIKRIKGESFKFGRIGQNDADSSDDDDEGSKEEIAAFEIDSETKNGRVALLFKGGSNQKPQIWFQDLSCKWYYIANTFTDYFRVMVMHLGIPNWQYAFTQCGLDQQTLQWFRFFIPERLSIDIENRKFLEMMAKKKLTSNIKPNS